MKEKLIIYQVLPRLFGNRNTTRKENGSIEENGCGKMNDFSDDILKQFKDFGVTHVWYTGVIRHATQTNYSSYGISCNHPAVVKGKAGSPYAITDYYDIDPDIAENVNDRIGEFEALIERTHYAGMKVIMDFVPNHVARQYHSIMKPQGVKDLGEDDDVNMAFSPNNNFYYCPGQQFAPTFNLDVPGYGIYNEFPSKATGNDRFDAHPDTNDWYETVKLNYGVDVCGGGACHFYPIPDTWIKMRDILIYWSSKGVDGFRCDMAEMVPQEFWKWVIPKIKSNNPNILFIGEVYQPNLFYDFINRCGFDYLYDKVGMCDTLRDIISNGFTARAITSSWQLTDSFHDNMLNLLENHDEQRLACDFLCGDGRKALPALIVSLCFLTKPFLIYMGQEFGERGMDKEGFSGRDGRTTIFDYWCVPSIHRWLENSLTDNEQIIYSEYRKIVHCAVSEKAIIEGMSFDLMYINSDSSTFNSDYQFSFLRKQDDELLFVVVNFSDCEASVGVKIPRHAFDYLSIQPTEQIEGFDLLSKEKISTRLEPDSKIECRVPAKYGRIYKFILH